MIKSKWIIVTINKNKIYDSYITTKNKEIGYFHKKQKFEEQERAKVFGLILILLILKDDIKEKYYNLIFFFIVNHLK